MKILSTTEIENISGGGDAEVAACRAMYTATGAALGGYLGGVFGAIFGAGFGAWGGWNLC